MKKMLVLLFAVLVFVGCGEKKPEDVTISFLNAGYSGDTATMMKLLNIPAEELKKDGSKEAINGKLQMMVADAKSQAASKGGVDSLKVIDSKIDGDSARVNVDIKFKNGEVVNSSTNLMKTENGWKIR